jgi:hypothetical protein
MDDLQSIPGVGKRIAEDLRDMGIFGVSDLKGRNPEQMYNELCALRKQRIDRCMLYVFRCAVYYADNTLHEPELLKWWNWKDKKSGSGAESGDSGTRS